MAQTAQKFPKWGVKNGFGITVLTSYSKDEAESLCKSLNEKSPDLHRNKWKTQLVPPQPPDPWFYVVTPKDLEDEARTEMSR